MHASALRLAWDSPRSLFTNKHVVTIHFDDCHFWTNFLILSKVSRGSGFVRKSAHCIADSTLWSLMLGLVQMICQNQCQRWWNQRVLEVNVCLVAMTKQALLSSNTSAWISATDLDGSPTWVQHSFTSSMRGSKPSLHGREPHAPIHSFLNKRKLELLSKLLLLFFKH